MLENCDVQPASREYGFTNSQEEDMSEDKKKKPEDDYDIFIANDVYPQAGQIFATRLKHLDSIKDECVVVLDTNSLLVPYAIGKESLKQIRTTYLTLIVFVNVKGYHLRQIC